jgi:YD repeat-containing protein
VLFARVVKTTDARGNVVAFTYWPDGQLAGEGALGSFSKAVCLPGSPT